MTLESQDGMLQRHAASAERQTAPGTVPDLVLPSKIRNADLLESGRGTIVAAAIDLFIQNGFHNTSVDEIAESAGLTVGGLYKYIRSKHDILLLVAAYQADEVFDAMSAWLTNEIDPIECLVGAVTDYIKICDNRRKIVRINYREAHNLNPEARKYFFALEDQQRRTLLEIVRRAAALRAGPISEKHLVLITDGV